MSEREHADGLPLGVTQLIRRARWPDGHPVRFRVDRKAQLLAISNHALHIVGVAIAFQLFNSLSRWWLLLTVPAGLLMSAAANARLHFVVDQMSRRGLEADLDTARGTTLRARALEHSARACEQNEQELRMKAESASASDGRRSRERYLERAERERKRADWIRRKIEKL